MQARTTRWRATRAPPDVSSRRQMKGLLAGGPSATSDGLRRRHRGRRTREARMTAAMAPRADRLTVRGVDLEVVRRGSGRTILFLHGFHPLDPGARFLERLSRGASVLAPSHPGFGASA